MQRNEAGGLILRIACLAVMVILLPAAAAHAQIVGVPGSMPLTIAADGTICPAYSGITNRIVTCIQDALIFAAFNFLMPFSTFMADTVSIACVLAVVLWGAMAATGRMSSITKEGAILAIKLGAVAMFAFNYGGLFPLMIDALDDMLNIVTGYATSGLDDRCPPTLYPTLWLRVDCLLAYLIGGFGAGVVLISGLLGFILAALFSGAVGFALFVMGVSFVLAIITAVAEAVFGYLMAIMCFGVLACLSPLFVPLILFRTTKAYFEKYIRITIGFLLQPIILFAYLGMLVVAFNVVVFDSPRSVVKTIAGAGANVPTFLIGDWLLLNGVYAEMDTADMTVNMDPEELAAGMKKKGGIEQSGDLGVIGDWLVSQVHWKQGTVIQKLLGTSNNFSMSVPIRVLDFCRLAFVRGFIGAGQVNECEQKWQPPVWNMVIRIIEAFLMAMLVAFIFTTILKHIPFLYISMAGGIGEGSLVKSLGSLGMKDTKGASSGEIGNFLSKRLGLGR